jgi:hypothetical protein
VSGHIASHLLGRFRSAWPFSADFGRQLGTASLDGLQARLAKVDIAAALIRFADRIEIGFGYLWRGLAGLRHLRVLLRAPGLRLGGGLIWRGIAAATGVGLTVALVTTLSAEPEVTIANLAPAPAQEARAVRDVRQEPRQSAGGRESWIPITKPIPMFGLESPELDRASASLESRRSQDGSQREDVLGFGGFAEPKAHLLLRLSVEHGRADLSQPFVIALVREAAARAMSVQRSGLPTAIQTRFGPVETADATLTDGDVARSCIAFRMDTGALPLSMSGWWCGGDGKPADRQQLVCLIDRIDLINAGDDRALRSAFARTELNRQPACVPPRLAASGRKVSWLDADGAPPALRTKSAAIVSTKPQPKR